MMRTSPRPYYLMGILIAAPVLLAAMYCAGRGSARAEVSLRAPRPPGHYQPMGWD